ncbi:MAG TPA: FAD-dependent oxidoreductase, partial [Actinomycetota bacterium]|nr:FAD-dependent oxidoreductase [Actinomycetota bacterium]
TVDDDPGVSRAVARDLRRRYGQDYRVVRAESGAQALEALREIKLRGDLVAVLLADYRMPVMSGLEFLEQAMDLFPHARRALLTAYADTDAAIQAINVVDLDHYLLKPWDPPEEKLYPVVDALIELWQVTGDKPITETQVVGHRWSARSFEVRDFLARNSVPYRWFTVEQPEGKALLEAAGLDETSIPLVVTPDGDSLVDPGVERLAAQVGLSTTPATDFYDTVIVGGGPAGLGAAVYAASEGLRTVLLERQATGGQAGQSSRIENYLGFPDGVSGVQLTDRARRQASKFGAEILTARNVAALQARGSSRVVRFADGGEVAAHTVVLATGVAYHKLEVPDADRFTGLGVFYGSAAIEAPAVADQDVYVVGGANSAGQAAMFLSRHARRVTLLVRADGLERSMSYYLIRQINDIPNIEVRTRTQVVGMAGQEHLEWLRLCDTRTGSVREVAANFLFVFIGAAPCTEWLDGVIARDRAGFVLTGPDLLVGGRRPAGWPLDRDPYYLEGSVPGVFAAGDA